MKIPVLLIAFILSIHINAQEEIFTTEFTKQIKSNYQLDCEFEGDMGRNNVAEICLHCSSDLSTGLILKITGEEYSVIHRKTDKSEEIVVTKKERVALPWKFRLVKLGDDFKFWINRNSNQVSIPIVKEEPTYIGVKTKLGLSLETASITQIPILEQLQQKGIISFDEKKSEDIWFQNSYLNDFSKLSKDWKTEALIKKESVNEEDLYSHLEKYTPPSTSFLEMKKNMNQGWNTWNTYSVLSHVLLPEGLAINLELKDNKTGKILPEALIGRKEDNSEDITPLAHSYDGSYTDLTINWQGVSARIQSATIGEDNVILISPYKSKNENGHLIINPKMLWERSGEIKLQDNVFEASLSDKVIPIYTTIQAEKNIKVTSSNLETSLNQIVAVSTGKKRSIEEVIKIISRAEKKLLKQKSKYIKVADLYEPLQNVLAWDVIYEPSLDQVIAPVSRVWNVTGFHGWVLFDWDTYFASYMFALDNKELAYSNALAITNQITPSGFVPNFGSGLGRSDDRSQPPVGAFMIKEIYKNHKEKWFLEETFEKLLDWNRWWDKSRSIDGYLCWGSDPYDFPTSFPEWLRPNVNKIQGSKWESGLDNSPMYDGIRHDSESHLMRLADVGLMSLYVMDCKALTEIAMILEKPDLAKEIKSRGEKYTKSIQSLWSKDLGIFLNKDLDKNELNKTLTPTLFYPMLAGVATQEQAERMIKEHFYNPKEFWGDYIIPTVSKDNPAYKDQNYWRGRIWAPLNFLVYLGLRNYDIPNAQTDLVNKSKALIINSWKEQRAVYENYNGTSGRGDDVFNSDKFYHWGALLSFISLIEDGIVKAPEKTINKK